MNKTTEGTIHKWLAGMLVFFIVLTVNVIPAKAAISGSLEYEIVSGQAYISDCTINVTGDFEIPESIDGYRVVGIGAYAFGGCNGLTSITIPSGVKSIGAYAFGECSDVISITIPSSVTSIGTYAFLNCKSLKNIEM